MRIRFSMLALLILVVCGIQSTAEAWSDAGHKIIASIAWRQLKPEQRDKILALLAQHPRFEEDFRSQVPENLTDAEDRREWMFQQAAVWPDMARGFPDDVKARFHHSTWHYINAPLYLTPADREHGLGGLELNREVQPPLVPEESMNIVQTIRMARRQLARQEHPAAERAVWIPWLFHTVGDLHQPLHSTTLVSQDRLPGGDRGGNLIPTKPYGNLHALWDNFPGGKLKLAEAKHRALLWSHDAELLAAVKTTTRDLNEETWMKESQQLSENVVYNEEVRAYLKQLRDVPIDNKTPPVTMTEEYLHNGGMLCRQRVLAAGLRLGAVLDQLFP